MARRGGRHVLAATVAVVLMASGATRGLCFMPGTGEAGPRDAHACCKKGWTSAPPECCMAGVADEDPARAVVAVALAAPLAILATIAQPPPRATRTPAAGAAGDRSHSPPGRSPLRI